MKVAIISDIHENFHNLILFMKSIESKDIERIIFLGDFINPGIALVLANSKIPVFAIWGNNDGDKVLITKASMKANSNLEIGFDTYDFLEIEDRKVFITHYPLLAIPMAKSGDFDAVFYGHNHKKTIDKINNCLIVNPGEISAHKTNKASYAIYDSKSNSAELIELEDIVSINTKKVEEHLQNIGLCLTKPSSYQYHKL